MKPQAKPLQIMSRYVVFAVLLCVATTMSACLVEDDDQVGMAASAVLSESAEGVCWRPTQLRGVGRPPQECDGERSGALCYPTCDAGFAGIGPVCWKQCPTGYVDDGAVCRRNASIIRANTNRCPRQDICGRTVAKGCSTCPPGYINDGCTCRRNASVFAKSSYQRGRGTPLSCSDDTEFDAGLCYSTCDAAFQGVGPVCWATCTGDMPISCGAGCAESNAACAIAITNQVLAPIQTVLAGVSGAYIDLVLGLIDTFNAYNLPLCESP